MNKWSFRKSPSIPTVPQHFSTGKLEERVPQQPDRVSKSDQSRMPMDAERPVTECKAVINPFVTESHVKKQIGDELATPQKDNRQDIPSFSLNDRPRDASPWNKFLSGAKKFAHGVGQMIGFCEKSPSALVKANEERIARQERNSTEFQPIHTLQKDKLEILSLNPDFQELCRYSFHERLKKSEEIKKADERVERLFEEKNKPNYPGESAREIYSRKISEVFGQEDLYSGFKPRRSELSEGEEFYAQLWKGANQTGSKTKMQNEPANFNLSQFISNSQNKFHEKIGFHPTSQPTQTANWFKSDHPESLVSFTKTETNFSSSENTTMPTFPVQQPNFQQDSFREIPESKYQYEISDVEDSDQELDTNETWKDEDDVFLERSCPNSNTRLALKEEFEKVRKMYPGDPISDIKLFNKRSGLNLSQTEFQDLLKMKTPNKPKSDKRVLFINNKRVPDWAKDLKGIGKEVIAQNTFGRYKQVFGKVKHIKFLPVENFFRPELLRQYKR